MTIEERNEWIMNNRALIKFYISPWLHYPNYEDYLQEAYLAAIKALDRTQGDVNYGYMGKCVKGGVMNYIHQVEEYTQPKNWGYRSEKYKLPLSLNNKIEDKDGETFEMNEFVGGLDKGFEDVIAKVDIDRLISKLKKPKKIKAMEMLADGYSRYEVAEEMGVTHQYVALVVKELKKIREEQM